LTFTDPPVFFTQGATHEKLPRRTPHHFHAKAVYKVGRKNQSLSRIGLGQQTFHQIDPLVDATH
jgi:hypothetical protein